MPILRLREFLPAVEGTVLGPSDELEFSSVSTDTREIEEGALFVALRGPHHDGHEYLSEAAKRGALAALVDRTVPPDQVAPLVQIRVLDTLEALQALARFHGSRSAAIRVGVTGSNGKTTTKELLRAALGEAVIASPRSFNNHIGVPLTLLRIREDTQHAVVELGTNQPGEIQALARLVRPQIGVITNCTWAHVEKLGNLDGVIQEKGALIEALPSDGLAVLNADDVSFEALRERAPCPVITYGVTRSADLRAADVHFDLQSLRFRLAGTEVRVPLGGSHNVSNALAAIAAAEACGRTRTDAIAGLAGVEQLPMRMRSLQRGDLLIVDDTYNANPGSMEAALRTLAAAHPDRRKLCVLGDMKELGDRAEELHRAVGREASLLSGGVLVAVGRWASAVAAGAREAGFDEDRVHVFADAEEAGAGLPALIHQGDAVLVKGSRAMAMERIIDRIEIAGGVGAA